MSLKNGENINKKQSNIKVNPMLKSFFFMGALFAIYLWKKIHSILQESIEIPIFLESRTPHHPIEDVF
jgi:hypothetical protein